MIITYIATAKERELEDQVSDLQAEIVELEKRNEKGLAGIVDLSGKVFERDMEIQSLEHALKDLGESFNTVSEDNDRLTQDNIELRMAAVEAGNSSAHDLSLIDELRRRLNEREDRIQDLLDLVGNKGEPCAPEGPVINPLTSHVFDDFLWETGDIEEDLEQGLLEETEVDLSFKVILLSDDGNQLFEVPLGVFNDFEDARECARDWAQSTPGVNNRTVILHRGCVVGSYLHGEKDGIW
jgi:uncharacterized coiled-coil protein SlyX